MSRTRRAAPEVNILEGPQADSVRGGDRSLIASMQRLERVARVQLERIYEGTRRGGSTIVAVDRRAVERVHELMALTRHRERDPRQKRSR